MERPQLVATISWAAGNGDRSENGDYIYGKKRLREVDRRIRFLVQRLDRAEVVDPAARAGDEDEDRVYFGATVDVVNAKGEPRTVSIVGVDEIDTARGYISWVSPMARALIKAREGDTVTLMTPGGTEELDDRGRALRCARHRTRSHGAQLTGHGRASNMTRMDNDLALLEQKLATLIAHTRALARGQRVAAPRPGGRRRAQSRDEHQDAAGGRAPRRAHRADAE